MAAKFVSYFPNTSNMAAETYMPALVDYFLHYHPNVVKKIVDPLHGMPSKAKWLPTFSELKEAMEEQNAQLLDPGYKARGYFRGDCVVPMPPRSYPVSGGAKQGQIEDQSNW